MSKNIFEYKSGLPVTPEQTSFSLELDGEILLINAGKVKVFGKNDVIQTYKIPLENIIDLDIVTEKELKEKSVMGRGVAGALLLGPVGAILGGMSGVGRKAKSIFMLSIAYVSPSAPGEVKNMMFNAEYAGWLAQNQGMVRQIKKARKGIAPSALVKNCLQALGLAKEADGSIML